MVRLHRYPQIIIMIEIPMSPDIIASLEQARQFVEVNKIPANNKKAICGDGRVNKEQSKGYLRAFGGDEGFMMTIQGAATELGKEISPTELVARYGAGIRQIRGDDAVIGTHTDEHNLGPDEIGCGHVAKAVKGQAKHKSIGPEDVVDLHENILAADNHEQIVLEGHHAEKAVLLIYGKEWTVNSFDGEHMYFVVDIDRSMEFIEQIVPLLGIGGLTIEAVKEQFECQMNETASHLAAGRNIFAVRFADSSSDGDFQIAHVGVVPPPSVQ
jgi:hypothetical protein